jgi:hypothetical protein
MQKYAWKPLLKKLTLGGVGRLRRIFHLEQETRAAAREEFVRARPNPWMQRSEDATSARARTRERDLTMAETSEGGGLEAELRYSCGGGGAREEG